LSLRLKEKVGKERSEGESSVEGISYTHRTGGRRAKENKKEGRESREAIRKER